MTGLELPKCPKGCDAEQERGNVFHEPARIGGKNLWMRWQQWRCTGCEKVYSVQEPVVQKAKVKKSGKKKTGKRKRGRPKKRRSTQSVSKPA